MTMNIWNMLINQNIYEYRNITSVVKELYNIKNVIKDDIDYFITFPYVIKVDVVQVIANKIDLDSKNLQI